MYYEINELLTKNRIYNYIIGNRGGGKSFGGKRYCVNDFLKNGNEFVWVRRYGTELVDIDMWANDIIDFLPSGTEIRIQGKKNPKCIINGKVAGYFIALSTSQRKKSVPYPKVTKIIFDEFIIDKGSLRYIKNECELFLELCESVIRLKNNFRVILIANAISIVNPYFTYFKIKPDIDKRYTLSKDSCIELYTNDEFIENKLKTKFGSSIAKTKYGQYAIENKFLRDTDSFIMTRSGQLLYSMTIVYESKKYGVWNRFEEDRCIMFIDEVIEPKCERVISVDYDSFDESCKFKDYKGLKLYTEQLRLMFLDGQVYYSSQEVKKKLYEVIKTL